MKKNINFELGIQTIEGFDDVEVSAPGYSGAHFTRGYLESLLTFARDNGTSVDALYQHALDMINEANARAGMKRAA